MKDEYYRVIKDRQDYKGEKYFRFNPASEKVVQICFNMGDIKKGRTNSFGVYMIHRLTFLSNYYAYRYVESISKKLFDSKFQEIIKMLK